MIIRIALASIFLRNTIVDLFRWKINIIWILRELNLAMNKYDFEMRCFNLYCLIYILEMQIYCKLSAKIQNRIRDYRLRRLIKKAYKMDFYRKRFDSTGVKPRDIRTVDDLTKLPILTKKEYREWMEKEKKTEEAKHYKLTYTSGSTGIPTTNIYPPKEYAKHYMMDMFCWMRGGYNPFLGKTLTCSPGDSEVGSNTFIQRLGILRRECFSMKWSRGKIIDKINTYKPDFILGYSAELSYIAQYALENSIEVHKPSRYCAGGEHVMGEQKKILEEVFGDGMINYYGCTEMADFAYRSPGENGYHINQDCVALCVETEDGIKRYGSGGILATPLYRIRYPLINYEIGDLVDLQNKDGFDYIEEINGRKQDIFYWDNGERTTHKDIWLVSKQLNDVYQIRFIQETKHLLRIQVVQDKNSKKSINEMERYLLDCYRDIVEDSVEIIFEWLSEIPPDDSGKIRNMISKI